MSNAQPLPVVQRQHNHPATPQCKPDKDNEKQAFQLNEQKHSALKFVTPAQRHTGEDVAILAKRHEVYQKARTANPKRWSGETRNWERENVMALNPEKKWLLFPSLARNFSTIARGVSTLVGRP